MKFSKIHAYTQEQVALAEKACSDHADFVSDLIVMASAAGWYVGRVCVEAEFPMVQPYSRETNYMSELEAIDCVINLYDEEYV